MKTPENPDNRPSRRHVLAAGVGLALAGREWRYARADDENAPGLIVRNRRPLDAETPVAALGEDLTPADLFFVRSHFGAPVPTSQPWTITVRGGVDRPMTLDLDQLRERFPVTRRRAVLQCSGNGRAFFVPVVPGVAWERGAVGNALWEGVRLRDVLEHAGVTDGQRHVHFRGADGPPLPRTPQWVRSLPLDRVMMRDDVLLATHMNGQPLPRLNGGPVRLVVPGWTGNHWMKWLRSIEVARDEAPGFYQQTGYRMPVDPSPRPPGAPPAETRPLTWMNVKSLIVGPAEGATLPAGPVEIRGVAWTGQGRVVKVEAELDGQWRDAELFGPDEEGSWRSWRLRAELPAGRHVVRARATDSQGATQPESPPWNRGGYLWNGYDRVSFLAR